MDQTNLNIQRGNKTFDKWFWISLVFFIAISAFICCFPSWFIKKGCIDFSKTGQIGDTIGGIMGPFVAIAAACLTFIAFWVQYKANIMQRGDIAIERFERNFFEMLNLQESITNSLVLEEICENDSTKNMKQTGRDVFQMLYESYHFDYTKSASFDEITIEKNKQYTGLKALFIHDEDALKCYVNLGGVNYLDHYFRHLYWIFKYIDTCKCLDDKEKYIYACIARSSLSQYELVLLFYNALSENGFENFKPLIEKYALMNNLRKELLAKQEDEYKYNKKAYMHPN